MSFPCKFASLLETELAAVEVPDYVWLVYAVCAVSDDGCGWGGWMVEAAFKADDGHHATSTGDKTLPAADEQVCPRCGRETYRTGVALRMVPSSDQTPSLLPGVDY